MNRVRTEEIEDGDPCPFCGSLAIFFEGEADTTCPSCGSELYNSAIDDNVGGNDLDEIDSEDVDDVESDYGFDEDGESEDY
ncbi:MAG: hypothetical protein RLZZ16_413 [Actinomycetota bacterium]|jgi:hypothetical protein